jgi:hypothetical protein
MKIMSKALLLLGAGLCLNATVSAQTISAGSASGTPGGGTTPALVPVNFTRNASFPVADFIVRVNFSAANLSATAAGINGGGCSIGGGGTFVTVLPPAGLSDVQTNTYCNITFTIAPGAPAPSVQALTLTFGPGGNCIDTNANPVTCALTDGSITVNPPAGNTPPAIAYAPATGTTINYSAGGAASPIVATPSGGSGSGAPATTTVGACTITGGGAAFPTTNIAQLSFVGPTVAPQNIALPACVPQVAAVNATLTCPESRGGVAVVPDPSWTLNCPAAVVAATPPTITYAPVAGSTINVASGSATTINVGCPTDGAACNGSGSGLAATSRLENLTAVFAGLASPQPTMTCNFVSEGGTGLGSPLDFVATQADAGDISCTCPQQTTGLPEPFTVSVSERIPASGGVTATRNFSIVCDAGQTCGSIAAAPANGTINLNNGGAGVLVSTVSVSGISAGLTQTVNCAVTNASAGSTFTVTTVPSPMVLSSGTTSGTVTANCTNSAQTTGTATLTCTSAGSAFGCPVLTASYTLSCPGVAAPPMGGEFVPVPALNEQGRILLAALVLLLGLGVVGFRMRG